MNAAKQSFDAWKSDALQELKERGWTARRSFYAFRWAAESVQEWYAGGKSGREFGVWIDAESPLDLLPEER